MVYSHSQSKSHSQSTSREWLDESGRFKFGKYGPKGNKPGQLAENVALMDHSYVQWIINNIEDMDEGDRGVLSSLLTYSESRR
jgi:hypothetical protein